MFIQGQYSKSLTQEDLYKSMLLKYAQIDLGVITDVNGNEAKVRLYSNGYDEVVSCEIVSIGDNTGVLQGASVGQWALVFFPVTAIELEKNIVHREGQVADRRYGKAFPIGLPRSSLFAGNSTLGIGSTTLAFFDDALQATVGETTASINADGITIAKGDCGVVVSNDSVAVKKGETVFTVTEAGVTVTAESLTLDGDVTITGSLDVANGNFKVDK